MGLGLGVRFATRETHQAIWERNERWEGQITEGKTSMLDFVKQQGVGVIGWILDKGSMTEQLPGEGEGTRIDEGRTEPFESANARNGALTKLATGDRAVQGRLH